MTTSAVYEGWVAHRRAGVVPHSFGYRVFMPLFDLEELPGLLDAIPLWSARRPAPARFRDGDYLPGDGDSLAERARNLVDARLGRRPAGPVRLWRTRATSASGSTPSRSFSSIRLTAASTASSQR